MQKEREEIRLSEVAKNTVINALCKYLLCGEQYLFCIFVSYETVFLMMLYAKEGGHLFGALCDYFNRQLFEGQLESVQFTINPLPSRPFLYQPNPEGRLENDMYRTEGSWIEFNPSTFSKASLIDLMSSLVRELVFLWQHQYGNPSRKFYCNREWSVKMQSIGLIPTDTGRIGGKKNWTKPFPLH